MGQLIDSADLRRKLGAAARRTVEERYSVKAWRDRYLELFNTLIRERHDPGNRTEPHGDDH
jgi:glycosyltransferase involved in cell wall biosynthesis